MNLIRPAFEHRNNPVALCSASAVCENLHGIILGVFWLLWTLKMNCIARLLSYMCKRGQEPWFFGCVSLLWILKMKLQLQNNTCKFFSLFWCKHGWETSEAFTVMVKCSFLRPFQTEKRCSKNFDLSLQHDIVSVNKWFGRSLLKINNLNKRLISEPIINRWQYVIA